MYNMIQTMKSIYNIIAKSRVDRFDNRILFHKPGWERANVTIFTFQIY